MWLYQPRCKMWLIECRGGSKARPYTFFCLILPGKPPTDSEKFLAFVHHMDEAAEVGGLGFEQGLE